MLKLLRSLLKRNEGQVTVLFALASVPVLLAAGAAVDRIRLDNVRTQMQASLDGAALAAAMAVNRTNPERVVLAKDYFKRNFPLTSETDVAFDVNVTATSVVASAKLSYPTTFMRLAGIESSDINEISEVMRPFAGKAEVVLVLDYSGSMNKKNKYQDMTAAATAMISSLDAAIVDGNLKVGLVPFSAMVYTSVDKNYVNQASATSTWTGCTQDRAYPYNITVDTPTSAAATKWGYVDPNGENNGGNNCNGYDNKNLKIVPMTTDIGTVKDKLSAMRPLGNTNIPLAAEFGWNLLDPQMPFTEGASYTDAVTRKFLILLTDGVQTSSEFGGGNGRSVANGNANLTAICDGMRAKGITTYTIAYDISDPAVTTLLKSCAPDHYYEPDAGGTEINKVFSQITSQIKNRTARLAK